MTGMPFDHASEQRKVRREAVRQEQIRADVTGWREHNSAGRVIQTDYNHDLLMFKAMEAVARNLAKSTEEPTSETIDHKGTVVSLPTPTGAALIALCRAFDPDLPARHRHHEFNPWIRAMVIAVCNWGMATGLGLPFPIIGIAHVDQDCLGRIARFVRLVSLSREFKRKRDNDQAVALSNYRSGCSLMIALFTSYPYLLVVRINLYFWCEGSDEVRSKKAQAAIDSFMPMLRSGCIEPNVVGCLDSHGEGSERGIHFHVLVALDGQACRDPCVYARAIGKRWELECGCLGQGTYFNSYAGRHKQQFNGVGLVHVSDWRKLIELRQALLSIAKSEYLIKRKHRPKKCFRSSSIKTVKAKLSASRQPGHDMATVLQILAA
jgi:hypothetical protein